MKNGSSSTEVDEPSELDFITSDEEHSFPDDTALLKSILPASIAAPIGENSPLLFPGATITAHQFDVAMASTALRHNLTYACQTDILQLIASILPSPNHATATSRSLTRKFIRYEQQSLLHQCCGVCMRLLEEETRCSNPQCADLGIPHVLFVEVPIDKQLQERFRGKS